MKRLLFYLFFIYLFRNVRFYSAVYNSSNISFKNAHVLSKVYFVFLFLEKSDPTLLSTASSEFRDETDSYTEDSQSEAATVETMKERKEKKWKMRDRSLNWRANYVSNSDYSMS